ncbi:RNA-protein complex protein Nop10 [Acidianus manzaensis]|uniref:Ribosome biogenesis protein Nop10 n=1 Tax=Acidianus manzaensis TaxID=282676 RepID=A0A1W6K1H2_9CREN|nr:RNA-protein complex protein Nop10 [Acidianus manzaensis]ARM76401.1 ribosome biogenesis protein [Acidianus manzaensis]
MTFKLRKCPKDNTYTFSKTCPICNSKTIIAHPPRFSPVDKYVKYRIEAKKGIKLNC